MSEKLTNFNEGALVESSSYHSNDHNGANGGNVTLEIAQIGAEAENEKRDALLKKIGGAKTVVEDGDRAGQQAMEDAVRSSAEAYASEVGAYGGSSNHKSVSPEAAKAFGEAKVQSFVEAQKKETESRVKDEVSGLYTNVRVGTTAEN